MRGEQLILSGGNKMSPICLTPPAARRSNGSATGAHRQYKRLSDKQKGFLRKLIHVLTDVIREEDLHETGDILRKWYLHLGPDRPI